MRMTVGQVDMANDIIRKLKTIIQQHKLDLQKIFNNFDKDHNGFLELEVIIN